VGSAGSRVGTGGGVNSAAAVAGAQSLICAGHFHHRADREAESGRVHDMESAAILGVPVVVETGTGHTWAEVH
jgi:hypothetical protein